MLDQAAELRNLVSQTARETSQPVGFVPRLVVFSGGKGGVGVSTLAIHVAMALVDQGLRVVLVDADLYRADIAPLCNLSERGHVGDILSARRDIHEVLERGPGGILVVPGVWAPDHEIPFSQHAQHRFLKQIKSLGRHADMVLMDVGSASVETVHRFWGAADDVVLVTTPESTAVMDCYATVKSALGSGIVPNQIRLIVNKSSGEEGADVYRRLRQSAERFLGQRILSLGSIPDDARLTAATRDQSPALPPESDGCVATSLQSLATALIAGTCVGSKVAA
ncbi:MAG: MinD/ParA family ATP-binding protein [Planctomycetota bacterium]